MKDKLDMEDKATKYMLFLKKVGIVPPDMSIKEFRKSGFWEGLED